MLSILLRDGKHVSCTTRFALLADRFSFTMGRTPILIPIPLSRPSLIDIGTVRPNMTLSGIVDTQGLPNQSDKTTNFMRTTDYTLYNSATSVKYSTQTYYHPYKNVLEDFVYYTNYDEKNTPIEIEVLGPSSTPDNRYHTIPAGVDHTGGAIYNAAIQSIAFNLNASKEDRYDFQMALVATTRLDQHKSSKAKFDPEKYKTGLGEAGGANSLSLKPAVVDTLFDRKLFR
jgi:hypothetical protein